jgi:hypothetical protein
VALSPTIVRKYERRPKGRLFVSEIRSEAAGPVQEYVPARDAEMSVGDGFTFKGPIADPDNHVSIRCKTLEQALDKDVAAYGYGANHVKLSCLLNQIWS